MNEMLRKRTTSRTRDGANRYVDERSLTRLECISSASFTTESVGERGQDGPKMNDTRIFRQHAHAAADGNSACLRDTSQPVLSSSPKICTERELSLDSVMDDMRAILWSDRCDQETHRDRVRSRGRCVEAAGFGRPDVSRAK
jgi:hypothetical protein